MMDITKLLEADHKEVKSLFEKALKKDEPDRKVVAKICQELTIHTQVEEKLLYPKSEKIAKAKDITDESYEEHRQAKELIKKLESGKLDDVEFKVAVEMLKLAIEHHVEEEEGELFPVFRGEFSQKQLDEMGQEAKALKEKLIEKVSR